MPPAEWTSDSSSESDGSEKDPFAIPLNSDLVIPSPVTLSDAEEDASPSQYRKEMESKQYITSDYEEGEELEEEEEEEDFEQETAAPKSARGMPPAMEEVYSEFLNMARKFTSMVEDTRKKELMSRKTARQSLAFDSPPRQAPKFRREHFTPPRHAREEIPATQYEDEDDEDFERDSLAGSSQTGSTRIRLQERWRIIGTRDKLTNSAEDIRTWIEEHATAEMAKAGLSRMWADGNVHM